MNILDIGDFIKQSRIKNKLTINQLALYSDVSAAHISRIERGLRGASPDILKKLSKPLKVSYEELLKISGYLDAPFFEDNTSENIKKDIPTKFVTIFKELIKEKNVTQKDVAKYLRVSDRLVVYYENGQRTPPPDILEKIADYFNVSVDYLLGRTDIKEPIHNANNEKPPYDELSEEIHKLSPESQEELIKLIELYKIRDMQKRNTEADDDLTNTD